MKTVKFPVIGCPSVSHRAVRIREHFMYQHFLLRIVVVQEGKELLRRCDLCGMHMPAE